MLVVQQLGKRFIDTLEIIVIQMPLCRIEYKYLYGLRERLDQIFINRVVATIPFRSQGLPFSPIQLEACIGS